MKFNFGQFKYLGIWSANAEAPFICLEPWYNTPDYVNSTREFKDKKDIIKLAPNDVFRINFSVEFFEQNDNSPNNSAKDIYSSLLLSLSILYLMLF